MWYFINTIVSIYHVRERLMNWSVLLKKEQCSLLLFPYHKIKCQSQNADPTFTDLKLLKVFGKSAGHLTAATFNLFPEHSSNSAKHLKTEHE
jgi:hypothetical protein